MNERRFKLASNASFPVHHLHALLLILTRMLYSPSATARDASACTVDKSWYVSAKLSVVLAPGGGHAGTLGSFRCPFCCGGSWRRGWPVQVDLCYPVRCSRAVVATLHSAPLPPPNTAVGCENTNAEPKPCPNPNCGGGVRFDVGVSVVKVHWFDSHPSTKSWRGFELD